MALRLTLVGHTVDAHRMCMDDLRKLCSDNTWMSRRSSSWVSPSACCCFTSRRQG